MSTTFHLIVAGSDGQGGPQEAQVFTYKHPAAQLEAARRIRDSDLGESDVLLWLDITHGVPNVGAFDPQFYTEAKR